MKVIELIRELNKYSSETEVLIATSEGEVSIDELYISTISGGKIVIK